MINEKELVSFKMDAEYHRLVDTLVNLSKFDVGPKRYESRTAFILDAINTHTLRVIELLQGSNKPGVQEFCTNMLKEHASVIEKLSGLT